MRGVPSAILHGDPALCGALQPHVWRFTCGACHSSRDREHCRWARSDSWSVVRPALNSGSYPAGLLAGSLLPLAEPRAALAALK